MNINGRIVEGATVKLKNCLRLDIVVNIIGLENGFQEGIRETIIQTRVHNQTKGRVIEVYAGDKQALVKWITGLKCRVPLKYLEFRR